MNKIINYIGDKYYQYKKGRVKGYAKKILMHTKA